MRTPAVGVLLLTLAVATPVLAQSRPAYNWEVEVHAGSALGTTPSSGAGGIPESAIPASFAFGAGTAMFNQFVPVRSALIVPFDSVLTTAILRQRAGPSLGMRLTRALNSRVSLEGSFTFGYRRGELTRVVPGALETTRSSYAAALQAVFANSPSTYGDPRVDITTVVADSRGYEVTGVGAFNVRLSDGGLQPFVTLGVGITAGLGDFPSFGLTGDSQFLFNGSPVRHRDRVTVHQHVGVGPLAIVGAGLRKDLTPRIGLRVDGRLYVGPSEFSTRVQASSSTASSQPLAIITPTPSGLTFVPVLAGSVAETAFRSSGTRKLGTITVGFFVRM